MKKNNSAEYDLQKDAAIVDINAARPPPHGSTIEERMHKIKLDLVQRVGDERKFAAHVGKILRAAVDYVIDAPTLYRYSIDELDPDEKTAIGKRIERLLRFEFKLPKGKKLDIKLAGEDVDIKTTIRAKWMFSKSSLNHINLLISYDEKSAKYKLGLTYVLDEQLGAKNRDAKQSMIAKHHANISWILQDEPYPKNFLAHLPEKILKEILLQKTGMARTLQLLRTVHEVPIPRHAICSVANQKDPLRRIRSNGGARDILWLENILVLSGKFKCDQDIAKITIDVTLQKEDVLAVPKNHRRLTPELLEKYRAWHRLVVI